MQGIMTSSYSSTANVRKNLFTLVVLLMSEFMTGESVDQNTIIISQPNHTTSSDTGIYHGTTNSQICHKLCLNNRECAAMSFDRETNVCTLGKSTQPSFPQAGEASTVETFVIQISTVSAGLNCADQTVSDIYSLTTPPQEQNLPTQYPSTNIINIDAVPVRRDVLSKEMAFDGNIRTAYSAHEFERTANPWISSDFMETVVLADAVYTSRQDDGYRDKIENLYLLAALDKADIDNMTLSLCSRFPSPRIEDKEILWLPCSIRPALHFKLTMLGWSVLSVGELEFYVY